MANNPHNFVCCPLLVLEYLGQCRVLLYDYHHLDTLLSKTSSVSPNKVCIARVIKGITSLALQLLIWLFDFEEAFAPLTDFPLNMGGGCFMRSISVQCCTVHIAYSSKLVTCFNCERSVFFLLNEMRIGKHPVWLGRGVEPGGY